MKKPTRNTFKTEVKEFTDFGEKQKYRISVNFGMHKIGDQEPYFSITGSIDRWSHGWRDDCGGCIHDEIAKHFPHLLPLIKWHLVSQSGIPMHYVANGQFWFERIGNDKEPRAEQNFKSTVVFGAVEGEEMPDSQNISTWCNARLPELQKAFALEMKMFGIEYI